MSRLRLAAWAVALAAAVAGCGGGGDSSTPTTATQPPTQSEPAPKPPPPPPGSKIDPGPMTIDLEPVHGSGASGTVRYRKAPSGVALLQIRAAGLDPVPAPEQYVLWQYSSRADMTVLGRPRVGSDGRLSADLQSRGFLRLLETEVKHQLLLARINRDRLNRELAKRTGTWRPPFVGEPVLRGTFARLYLESFNDKS